MSEVDVGLTRDFRAETRRIFFCVHRLAARVRPTDEPAKFPDELWEPEHDGTSAGRCSEIGCGCGVDG